MTVQRAIQTVTAKIQAELDSGRRSAKIDAHDLVEAPLAIGDELERQPENKPIANYACGNTPLLGDVVECRQLLVGTVRHKTVTAFVINADAEPAVELDREQIWHPGRLKLVRRATEGAAIAHPPKAPLLIAAPSEILSAANDAFLMLRRKNRAIDGKLTPDERQVMNALELALKLNGIVNQ